MDYKILKQHRKDNNMSRWQMSQLLEVSQVTIEKYEQGVIYPRFESIVAVASAYKLDNNELLQYLGIKK